MTASWGHCLRESVDVLVTADRRCVNDGSLVIPASFGRHSQVWRDGQWLPHIPRPEGYVYRPPAFLAADPMPAAKTPPTPKLRPESWSWKTPTAERPAASRTTTRRFGGRQRDSAHRLTMAEQGRACRDCGRGDIVHKAHGRCANCHRIAQNAAAGKAPHVVQPRVTVACPICSTPFKVRNHGNKRPQRYCSNPCSAKARSTRPPMSASGQVCRECGTGDRPHRSGGLCTRCHLAAERRAVGKPVRRRYSKATTMPCPVCATPFRAWADGRGGTRKYCSAACYHVSKPRQKEAS